MKKKQKDEPNTPLTLIQDIEVTGSELTDEELRLVSGGRKRRTGTYTWSWGSPDVAYDS